MQVRTDDEVYRVDAVWLGPPKATFPWRARYVAWGVGILVFLVVLSVQRAVGFGFGFFTVAWGLVITVVLTRFICSRISHERPLGAVLAMWARELTAPRERTGGHGGAASATRIRVHTTRPRRAARAAAVAARQPVGQRAAGGSGTAGRHGNTERVHTVHRRAGHRPVTGANATTGQRRAGQRSKEVGGVRTPGRR